MSEINNDKIKELEKIQQTLEKDKFLLLMLFFDTSMNYRERTEKVNNTKNTITEDIYNLFLGEEPIFKILIEAERRKNMDANEDNLVEKNEIGVQGTLAIQMHNAINLGKKMMTYTELTNTEAYYAVFSEIFEEAKKKLEVNQEITVKEAIENSIKELTVKKQFERIAEQFELDIAKNCDGLNEDEKNKKIEEIKTDFKNKIIKKRREEIYKEKEEEIIDKKREEIITEIRTEYAQINNSDEREEIRKKVKEIVEKEFEDNKNEIKNEIKKEVESKWPKLGPKKLEAKINQKYSARLKDEVGRRIREEFRSRGIPVLSVYHIPKSEVNKRLEEIKNKIEEEIAEITEQKLQEELKFLEKGIYSDIEKDTIDKIKTKTTDEIFTEKENKLKNRINKFYEEAEKIVKDNENKKYIEFSPRYKAVITVNQLNLKKLKKEHKYGEENLVLKNEIEILKEKLKKESELREEILKSDINNLKSNEEKAFFYSIKLSECYETIAKNEPKSVVNSVKKDIEKYLNIIEQDADLTKEFYKLQLLKFIELEKPGEIKNIISTMKEKQINLEDIKYKDGKTLIQIIAENDNIEIFKCFENEIDINKEIDGNSLSNLFVENINFDSIDYLVNEKGQNIENFKTKNGENLFHIAAKNASSKRMKILMEKFKDLDIKITFGENKKNILDVAKENNNNELANYLINELKMTSTFTDINEEERVKKEEAEKIQKTKEFIEENNKEKTKFCLKSLEVELEKEGVNLKTIKDFMNNKEKLHSNYISSAGTTKNPQEEYIDKIINSNEEILKLSKNNYFETGILDLGSNLEKLSKKARNILISLIVKEGNRETFEFFEEKFKLNIEKIRDEKNFGLIHLAVLEKNKELINALTEKYGEDIINQPLEHTKQTPLMLATEWGKKEIADFLIFKGAKVDLKSVGGRSVLYSAVKNGDLEMIENLIKNNEIDINQKIKFANKTEKSLLSIAAEQGKYDIINLFLKKEGLQIDFNEKLNKNGETILHNLVKNGKLDLIKKLSGFKGFDINIQDEYGKTPLHYAVNNGSPVLINTLKDIKEIKLNIQDKYGKTPLHYAVENKNAIATQSLLINNKDIDINIKDNYGYSPFFYAIINNEKDLINLFLNREDLKIDLEEKNYMGKNILHFAIKNNNIELFEKIKDNVNFKDKSGSSLLFYATIFNNKKIINLLLEKGAKIDFNEKHSNENILHFAIKNKNIELIKKILENKDVDLTVNNHKKTIIDYIDKYIGQNMLIEKDYEVIDELRRRTNEQLKLKKTKLEISEQLKKDNEKKEKDYIVKLENLIKDNDNESIKTLPLENITLSKEKQKQLFSKALETGDLKLINSLNEKFNFGDLKTIDNKFGKNLLYLAVENENENLVKELFEQNYITDINTKDKKGCSAFLYAVAYNNQKIIDLFINSKNLKIDFNEKLFRYNLLEYAVINGNKKLAEKLIENPNFDLDTNFSATNVFVPTVRNGNSEILDFINNKIKEKEEEDIEKNKENFNLIKDKINSSGETNFEDIDFKNLSENKKKILLFEAVKNGANYEKIESLNSKFGFDLKELKNSEGQSLLHVAVKKGNKDLVKKLISEANIDPNSKDYNNLTPLYFAIQDKKEDIVKSLLFRCETINEKIGISNNISLLSTAVLSGNLEITKLLLNSRDYIDINIKNNLGQSPIFDAIATGNKEMVKLLIENGERLELDLKLKSNSGKTPLEYANYRKANKEIKELIEKAVEKQNEREEQSKKDQQSLTQSYGGKLKIDRIFNNNKEASEKPKAMYLEDFDDLKEEVKKLTEEIEKVKKITEIRIRTAKINYERRLQELAELKIKKEKKENEKGEIIEGDNDKKEKIDKEIVNIEKEENKRLKDLENRAKLIKVREEILEKKIKELNLLNNRIIKKENFKDFKDNSNKAYKKHQEEMKELLTKIYSANKEFSKDKEIMIQ